MVQKLRNKYDAILTGSGTVIADDPSMLCTIPNGKNPIKIVLDTHAKTNPNARIFEKGKIILATTEKTKNYPKNVEILICPLGEDQKIDLYFLTKELYKKGICSILVEAGSQINSSFLKNNLADKIYHFIAPKILGDNEAISCFSGFDITDINNCFKTTLRDIQKIDVDVIITYSLTSSL
jgi:diaminohydroxyphosphoribosylaminopyrimidine deaminase/5-amino-6-(5-phosphoribosylamino)uracil reductase